MIRAIAVAIAGLAAPVAARAGVERLYVLRCGHADIVALDAHRLWRITRRASLFDRSIP